MQTSVKRKKICEIFFISDDTIIKLNQTEIILLEHFMTFDTIHINLYPKQK